MKKNEAYKNNNGSQSFATFPSFQNQLSSLITTLKNKYCLNVVIKRIDISTSPKAYWFKLKTFLNNKKIIVIPPIFHENKFQK